MKPMTLLILNNLISTFDYRQIEIYLQTFGEIYLQIFCVISIEMTLKVSNVFAMSGS